MVHVPNTIMICMQKYENVHIPEIYGATYATPLKSQKCYKCAQLYAVWPYAPCIYVAAVLLLLSSMSAASAMNIHKKIHTYKLHIYMFAKSKRLTLCMHIWNLHSIQFKSKCVNIISC